MLIFVIFDHENNNNPIKFILNGRFELEITKERIVKFSS